MSNSLAISSDILRVISLENRSGCLLVNDPQDRSVSWKLYLNDGYLSYVTSAVGQQERLTCLWQQFQPDLPCPEFSSPDAEYETIYRWWLSRQLPSSDLQRFLLKLSQEALAQILAIEQPSIDFFADRTLEPTILNYSWQEALEQSPSLLSHWQSLQSYLPSAFSRLYLDSQEMYQFYQFWQTINKQATASQEFSATNLSLWLRLMSQKTSLYEMARQIGTSPIKIAWELLPLLKTKVIQVLPFQEQDAIAFQKQDQNGIIEPQRLLEITSPDTPSLELYSTGQAEEKAFPNSTSPTVACIDDSQTVQRQVKMTLEVAGYQVLSISEPASTLTQLVRQKPALILLDINMPEINGYELCQMLQRSRKLRDIPVVMLTGREGMVDRLRAKLVGANHYLTKPFNPQELIEVVQRLARY